MDINSDKDSSSLDGQIEPDVCKFSYAKISEYDAMRVTSYKCKANFVVKHDVRSNEGLHHMKAFISELCKVGNLAKNI